MISERRERRCFPQILVRQRGPSLNSKASRSISFKFRLPVAHSCLHRAIYWAALVIKRM
jgi:hypothetical protein